MRILPGRTSPSVNTSAPVSIVAGRSGIEPVPPESPAHWLASGTTLVAFVALVKLALQLAAPHYGMFRDEMYYIACGQHLGWGYVDHPPLMPAIAWFAFHVFGHSLIG